VSSIVTGGICELTRIWPSQISAKTSIYACNLPMIVMHSPSIGEFLVRKLPGEIYLDFGELYRWNFGVEFLYIY
jgi:hypothetical protein